MKRLWAALLVVTVLGRAQAGEGEGYLGRVALLARWSSLEPFQQGVFANGLARRGDVASLRIISQSGLSDSAAATGVLVSVVDADEAVRLCRSFPIGSADWRAGTYNLRWHPKAKVEGYLKEVATSTTDPDARHLCYGACQWLGSDVLVELARQDANDSTVITEINGSLSGPDTLGKSATRYLSRVSRPKSSSEKPGAPD
jgi:hypothetical protein